MQEGWAGVPFLKSLEPDPVKLSNYFSSRLKAPAASAEVTPNEIPDITFPPRGLEVEWSALQDGSIVPNTHVAKSKEQLAGYMTQAIEAGRDLIKGGYEPMFEVRAAGAGAAS